MSIDKDHHWNVFGYPKVLWRDFFLPWLRKSQHHLTEDDCMHFQKWQDEIMKPDMLKKYYLRVEEIRGPIWESISKQIREERESDKKKSKE